jgi:hypothetical protein
VSYAVVYKNWKLLSNNELTHTELYDITANPFEKNDLTSKNPEITQQLVRQIKNWEATLPTQPAGKVFSAERGNLNPEK